MRTRNKNVVQVNFKNGEWVPVQYGCIQTYNIHTLVIVINSFFYNCILYFKVFKVQNVSGWIEIINLERMSRGSIRTHSYPLNFLVVLRACLLPC